jgi:hypothetical protein
MFRNTQQHAWSRSLIFGACITTLVALASCSDDNDFVSPASVPASAKVSKDSWSQATVQSKGEPAKQGHGWNIRQNTKI